MHWHDLPKYYNNLFMKRLLIIGITLGLIIPLLFANEEEIDYGMMARWQLHPAYSNVTALTASKEKIFALSEGALFAINKTDETIEPYNKLDGLSSADMQFVAFNKTVDKLVIIYRNGMIDIVSDNKIATLSDLYLKRETTEITFNNLTNYQHLAYLATSTGIIVVDLKKEEIRDTYYIGQDATDVNVRVIAFCKDSIFAITDTLLYKGALKDNLIDYQQWKTSTIPSSANIQSLTALNDLYLLQDSILYRYTAGTWTPFADSSFIWIRTSNTQLLAETKNKMLISIKENGTITRLTNQYPANDALCENGEYWLASGWRGVIRYNKDGYQLFLPDGPYSNLPYRLQFIGERLMMTQGGRWATQFSRPGQVIWYNTFYKKWNVISYGTTYNHIHLWIFDIMNYAVDPNDINHIFATTYGQGLIEFKEGKAVKAYNEKNSPLRSAASAKDTVPYYVRTDGALYDTHGNLWMLNTGTRGTPVCIMDPNGVWHQLPLRSEGLNIHLTTPSPLLADSKYPNSKWFLECRETPGVIVTDDGGTPFEPSDDHTQKRSTFVDQNGTAFTPTSFHTIAQDKDGELWVGTNAGLFIIESVEKFLASNECKRVIISREDEETQLADYLLADEQINSIVVDAGNRKWIGTASSGLFLMSSDGQQTIEHFTIDNSPIPSNEILSLAIQSNTGDVYIGTASGLASYRSDASDPEETYEKIYAYPNPIRPDYEGTITICRLMDNSVVNIIDAGGNLVCKTRSNGGIAIWDGKDMYGNRVASGIYTILCNAESGEHATTKILILHK